MIRGSIPALVTPFRDGAVDMAAFADFVDWQISEGSTGLVPCGTTGESPTLSHAEHYAVIRRTVEVAARPRAGDRRLRIERHGDGNRPYAHADKRRRRCRAGRRALLQQADPGRAARAFPRARETVRRCRSSSTTSRAARWPT